MKKRLIVVSCMLVLILCTSAVFAACAGSKIAEEDLQTVLNMIHNDFNGTTVSANDVLPGEFETTDVKGNEAMVYFTWKVTDTAKVTAKKNADGSYSLSIIGSDAISFTVKVTVVDAKGNAYLDSNKQPMSTSFTMKTGTSTGGGQQGDGDNQGDGQQQGGGGSGTEKTVTFEFNGTTCTDQAAAPDMNKDGISVTFAAGSNSNPPKYYTNGESLRLYGGNSMTISGKTIVKIELTMAKEYDTNEITVNVGTLDLPTWTGSAQSVTFTIGGTSGNRRITKMVVTYAE